MEWERFAGGSRPAVTTALVLCYVRFFGSGEVSTLKDSTLRRVVSDHPLASEISDHRSGSNAINDRSIELLEASL
jgi:hypothetical protein